MSRVHFSIQFVRIRSRTLCCRNEVAYTLFYGYTGITRNPDKSARLSGSQTQVIQTQCATAGFDRNDN